MSNQSLVLISSNLSDTHAIALIMANLLEVGAVLLLRGNLGSGKTAFVKGLALGLGVKAIVTSPTFTLVDEYDCGRLSLYHMDLYRLSSQEIKDLHLEEYWRGIDFPLGVVAIEWAERLEILPDTYLKLSFSRLADSDLREIQVTGRGDQFNKIVSNQSLLEFCNRD
jgi:tRNA threonylcarbamoyladenosine biosynthesis protein TsaE